MYFELNYKGKKVPVQLGYYALKMTQQQVKEDFNPNQAGMNIALFEPLLFHAIEKAHRRLGKENPYTMEDVEDMLEDNFSRFVEMVPKAYASDEEVEKPTEEVVQQKTVKTPPKTKKS
jgi:hypothetical protein